MKLELVFGLGPLPSILMWDHVPQISVGKTEVRFN